MKICDSLQDNSSCFLQEAYSIRHYKFCKFLLIIGLFSVIAGCKKFVQIDPPITQLVTASVFNNSATATAAQTEIYTEMWSNAESFYMARFTGLLSDELTNYSGSSQLVELYTNNLLPSQGLSYGCWKNAYNYIYQENAILSALQGNGAIPAAIVQQLTGEAKFIRAFWYFYLTSSFGDVLLTTSPDYTVNAKLSRTPKTLVYKQIIADLLDAQSALNSNFVDGSDTATTTDRVRPTKWAASALLARVYLFEGDRWDSAEAQATTVINNNTLFGLVPDLSNVFLANSQEAIWQLGIPMPYGGINTNDGFGFILNAAPTGTGNPQTVSPGLLDAFEPNDNRKMNWIGVFSDTTTTPATPYYFPYKYKSYLSSNITEFTMVLRLAEQYLIRAEARAQQGNLSGAISDLNVIRNRAGLSNTTATSQSDVLSAILHERQVELFTEWGHRWFDLIRSGNINSVMGAPGNVCQAKGGTWNPSGYQQLLPIPTPEILLDPNLTQNPGYH